MNFIKLAFVSIKRQPIKSSILFFLILILGTLMIASISIRNAVHTTELNLRRNMLPVVLIEEQIDASISPNDERWLQRGDLTPEILYDFAQLPYVSYFDYHLSDQLTSIDLTQWKPEIIDEPSFFSLFPYSSETGVELFVSGVSHPDFIDLRLERLEITQGDTFTAEQLENGEYVVVVSEKWAFQNGLGIGDIFQVENSIIDHELDYPNQVVMTESYEFTIIGLFKTDFYDFSPNVNDWDITEMNALSQINRMYIPNTTMRRIRNSHRHLLVEIFDWNPEHVFTYAMTLRPIIYVLDDHANVDSFIEMVEPLLSGFFVPFVYSDRFAIIDATMSSLINISNTILIASTIATMVIVGLIVSLFLHDRRHEFGIFLSMGMKKQRLVGQVIFEVGIVSLIAIIVSLFTGNLIANEISHTMLENELASMTHEDRDVFSFTNDTFELFGFGRAPSGPEMMEIFDSSLTLYGVLLYTISGVLIIGLATVFPLIYVLKLSPKKILE